ncbi:hypothetical protein AB4177_11530 [Vibrio breoganii]
MQAPREWTDKAKSTFQSFDGFPDFQREMIDFYRRGCEFGRSKENGVIFRKLLTANVTRKDLTPVRDRITAIVRSEERKDTFSGWPKDTIGLLNMFSDRVHIVFYHAHEHSFDSVSDFDKYKKSEKQCAVDSERLKVWARALKKKYGDEVPFNPQYVSIEGDLRGCRSHFLKVGTQGWLDFCDEYNLKTARKKTLSCLDLNNDEIKEEILAWYAGLCNEIGIYVSPSMILSDPTMSVIVDEDREYKGSSLKGLLNRWFGEYKNSRSKCHGVENIFKELKSTNRLSQSVKDSYKKVFQGVVYDSHQEIWYAARMKKYISKLRLPFDIEAHPVIGGVNGDFLISKKIVIEVHKYNHCDYKRCRKLKEFQNYMHYYYLRLKKYHELGVPCLIVRPNQLADDEFWIQHLAKIGDLLDQKVELKHVEFKNTAYPGYWDDAEHIVEALVEFIESRKHANPPCLKFPSHTELTAAGYGTLVEKLKPSNLDDNKEKGIRINSSAKELTRALYEDRQAFALRFGVFATHPSKIGKTGQVRPLRGATPEEALTVLLTVKHQVNFHSLSRKEFEQLVGKVTMQSLLDHFGSYNTIKEWIVSKVS